MIRHIVMWRMKEQAQGLERAGLARELKRQLEALPALVPQIRSLEVGLNLSPRDVARDIVLVSDFASPADLEAYAVHPEHQKVVAFVKSAAEETRVVDYELP